MNEWSKCFEIFVRKPFEIGSELIISRLEIGRLHSDQAKLLHFIIY